MGALTMRRNYGLSAVSMLVVVLTVAETNGYTFDFSSRGPGQDYTGFAEDYQLSMNERTWSYCTQEAEEFHNDFWGYYCAERPGYSCIEIYDGRDGEDRFLYPGCARGSETQDECTPEQAALRNCPSGEVCMAASGVSDQWNEVEAVRLSCEEPDAQTQCTPEETAEFCGTAPCRKTVDGDVATFQCQTLLNQWDSPSCGEDYPCTNPEQAYCSRVAINGTAGTECACNPAFYGDGTAAGSGCLTDGVWRLRAVLTVPRSAVQLDPVSRLSATWTADRQNLFELMFSEEQPRFRKMLMEHDILPAGPNYHIEVSLSFPNEADANVASELFTTNIALPPTEKKTVFGVALDTVHLQLLNVFADNSGSGQVLATGLDITSITFNVGAAACGAGSAGGCWVVDFTFTTGRGFNLIYIPRAEGDDSLDFDYSEIPADSVWELWGKSPADTYLPGNFPCTTADFDAGAPRPEGNPSIKVTACCVPELLDLYRPIASFDLGSAWGLTVDKAFCDAVYCQDCPEPGPALPVFSAGMEYPESEEFPQPGNHLDGVFAGLTNTRAQVIETVDPYMKQYRGRVWFDELELRRKAGMMEGTAGVEYVVDTFIGIAELRPTGSEVVDTFMKQVAIHVEKTDYFQITSHGENEYTYLQYINVRLVEVMFENRTESLAAREEVFLARKSVNVAHYAQLTFTVEQGFKIKDGTDMIPLDSLRVGAGTFLHEVEPHMHYPCREFLAPDDANTVFDQKGEEQTCAPDAEMCSNPTSIDDQFVAFNVPLGIDWIPEPSAMLDSIVFIHTAVQVEKTSAASTGSSAQPGELIRTVLSVSMPVVPGGVNIFCDNIVARTDLRSVADALVIVGSAQNSAELTRLRIVGGPGQESITDTVRDPSGPVSINSSSIEAGLMTLVVLGSPDYFDRPPNGAGQRPQSTLFGINLEDVITVHIMEQYGGWDGQNLMTTPNGEPTRFAEVVGLVNEPGELFTDAEGELNVLGYKLNGAFRFEIDRRLNTAHLEPTPELLSLCTWRASAPSTSNFMSVACILRRDMQNQQPVATQGQTLAWNATAEADFDFDLVTAIELPTVVEARNGVRDGEMGGFMQTIVGESDYGDDLGVAFANLVANTYKLNGQYNRAWWINPGYDWVPSQTGGARIFQISQKLIMFALFNLDENRGIDSRRSGISGRRHLLSNVPDASGAGMSTTSLVYNTNLLNNLATALGVPQDQVGSWTVTMQLTVEEECMSKLALEAAMRDKFVDFLSGSASQVKMVQIMSSVVRTSGDVQCAPSDRRSRALLSGGRRAEFTAATAELDTVVAFNTAEPYLDKHKFLTMPAVLDIQELLVPAVITVTGDDPAIEAPPPVSPNSNSTTVILVTAFSLVSGTVCALLGMWACRRWRKRLAEEEEYDKEGAGGVGEGDAVAHGLTLTSFKDEILRGMERDADPDRRDFDNAHANGNGNGHHRASVSSNDSVKF